MQAVACEETVPADRGLLQLLSNVSLQVTSDIRKFMDENVTPQLQASMDQAYIKRCEDDQGGP